MTVPLLDGLGAQIARWIIEIHKSFAFAELVIGFERKGLPNIGTAIPDALRGYTEPTESTSVFGGRWSWHWTG